uniref:Uncharacterized protein n=1 Tax=Panagrolaimus sp. JU765 TaxID=591449 RepID=A0AC34RHN2_9BILA
MYRTPHHYDPPKTSIFEKNKNPAKDLIYLINEYLRNFSKNEIVGGTEQFPFISLIEQICRQYDVLMKQGPFHKCKNEITDFILLLADLKYEIEKIPPMSPLFDTYEAYFVECQEKLQLLFNENILPAQRDWLRTNYKKGDDYLKFLNKQYAKKWKRQLVITSKDWIKLFEQFYGNAVYDVREPIEGQFLESYTWIFDEERKELEPYLIFGTQHFVLGVVSNGNGSECKHLAGNLRVRYICIRCKKLTSIVSPEHDCRDHSQTKFDCLQCWKSSLNESSSNSSQSRNDIQIIPDTDNEIKYRTNLTQFQASQRRQPTASRQFPSRNNHQVPNRPQHSQFNFQFQTFPETADPFSNRQKEKHSQNSSNEREAPHSSANNFQLFPGLSGMFDQMDQMEDIMFQRFNRLGTRNFGGNASEEMDDRTDRNSRASRGWPRRFP